MLEKKIDEQHSSNLSIPAWCRQNEINIHVFRYWQKKLDHVSSLSRSAFAEINSTNDEAFTGVIMEYQGISIHVHPHFDSLTLKRCLGVLKQC